MVIIIWTLIDVIIDIIIILILIIIIGTKGAGLGEVRGCAGWPPDIEACWQKYKLINKLWMNEYGVNLKSMRV